MGIGWRHQGELVRNMAPAGTDLAERGRSRWRMLCRCWEMKMYTVRMKHEGVAAVK